MSTNICVRKSTARPKGQTDVVSPELVDLKPEALLTTLTMENFESNPDQITHWANNNMEAKREEEAAHKRTAEDERARKEEEEKERTRQAKEKKNLKEKKEQEDRLCVKEEEERFESEAEKARIAHTEEERKQQDAPKVEEAQFEVEEADDVVQTPSPANGSQEPEDGEDDEVPVPQLNNDSGKKLNKSLRIDTSVMPPLTEVPRRRPRPLHSTPAKRNVSAPPPSALLTARAIENLSEVAYPEGIKSPKVELNANVRDGRFRYDRDFLLQFMHICKLKPPTLLPTLGILGIEPVDQSSIAMTCSGPGRHRNASGTTPVSANCQASVGLGIGSFQKPSVPSGLQMGKFRSPGSKLTSEERFILAPNVHSTSTGGAGTPSQGGPDHPMAANPTRTKRTRTKRTRTKRGEKRSDAGKETMFQQGQGSGLGSYGVAPVLGAGSELAPLDLSTKVPASTNRKIQHDIDSPELVACKVKALLNKLSMQRFDLISDQIIHWTNKSVNEEDGRTLVQVIRLVFEHATNEPAWSEMYARLCRKMMDQISPDVPDDGIKNAEGKPIAGSQLFQKYFLSLCQENIDRGWLGREATPAARTSDDRMNKVVNEQKGSEEAAADMYYAALKAKRLGLGLTMFLGELFKRRIITECIIHERVKKLLCNVEHPEEEELESLCCLLQMVGQLLDTRKARAQMDVYFTRMKELGKGLNVSFRMQSMLQDVVEFRDRKWIRRNAIVAPTMIVTVREATLRSLTFPHAVLNVQAQSRPGVGMHLFMPGMLPTQQPAGTPSSTKSRIPLPSQSAWAKSPPQSRSSTAPSPRSQSPAPTHVASLKASSHSRRPSALGRGVSVRDGVSVPRNNVGSVVRPGSVGFGSIDDALSPAATPAVKAEVVQSFGFVSATSSGFVNRKTLASGSATASLKQHPKLSSSTPSNSSTPSSTAPTSTAYTPELSKANISKLFPGSGCPGGLPTQPPLSISSLPPIPYTGITERGVRISAHKEGSTDQHQ
ncbi:hypothetical protein EV702DRAFT_504229 [Suillus placidus]|uniref:MIF4G domain-containing protein n=1 Tax=Suillus placidus TaxID=48579 RepID=A0A9P7A5C1_9AGAM|nr:hypothetical protein EV702DRAFT_504229 [Suillus placidus]